MRTRVIISVLAMISVLFASAPTMAQKGGEATVKLRTDITCQSCKSKIEKYMAYEKGVIAVDADIEADVVTITYKPSKTDAQALSSALAKCGYENSLADSTAHNEHDDHDHSAQPKCGAGDAHGHK